MAKVSGAVLAVSTLLVTWVVIVSPGRAASLRPLGGSLVPRLGGPR